MNIRYAKKEFNFTQFIKELGDVKNKISGFQHKNGIVTVFLSLIITPQEKTEIDAAMDAHLPVVNQKELDEIRFQKRAAAKDSIIARMAASNLERVRNGVWTTVDLVSLTEDAQLKKLLDDVNTLSYEIAYFKIDNIQNALLTPEIKNEWKSLLLEHFYL